MCVSKKSKYLTINAVDNLKNQVFRVLHIYLYPMSLLVQLETSSNERLNVFLHVR